MPKPHIAVETKNIFSIKMRLKKYVQIKYNQKKIPKKYFQEKYVKKELFSKKIRSSKIYSNILREPFGNWIIFRILIKNNKNNFCHFYSTILTIVTILNHNVLIILQLT